ncbi:MAG: hypothetical protein K0R57_3664 [Paenibacillaceae bacterium]|nr:hypothetical protein [Paenibacillaceae bacterium]
MCFVKGLPENHGVSSRSILNFVEATEHHPQINLNNFMLLSGNHLLAQFCKKPYDPHEISCCFP